MREVVLVCGVPGSGKSWVCQKLDGYLYEYVSHDTYREQINLVKHIRELSSKDCDRPILVDCPFAERSLRDSLLELGIAVKPYFIVEPTEVVQNRYLTREGRELPQASVTRSKTILNRANEWEAPRGTSEEIYEMLFDYAKPREGRY